MTRKRVRSFWPELPIGRTDNDHVYYLLCEWVEWAELGSEEASKSGEFLSLSSIVHCLAVALIMELHPHAIKRGFRSEIFKNINELSHALGYAFAPGYWRELAEALELCYSLSEPWELSSQCAKKYADELHRKLKDIALYKMDARISSLAAMVRSLKGSPSNKGEVVSTVPTLKKVDEDVAYLKDSVKKREAELLSKEQELEKIKAKNKDRTKKATQTRRENSAASEIYAALARLESDGKNINARDVAASLAEKYRVTQNHVRKLRTKYLESKTV